MATKWPVTNPPVTTVSPTLSGVSANSPVSVAGVCVVTVVVRNAYSQPLAGVPVTIAVSGSGNIITQPAVVTDVNGLAQGSFSSTTAEAKTVTAIAGLTSISNNVVVTVQQSGGGAGELIFAETFADSNFASRGWYDFGSTDFVVSPAPPGMSGALRFTWTSGQPIPSTGTMRRLFTASDRVYLRYQISFSSNWVGSGQPYHPHIIEILSDLDGQFDGLSDNRLAVYSEFNYQAGNKPYTHFQDNQFIDPSHIGSLGTDEARSTCGANGQRGYADNFDVFADGGKSHGWSNARQLTSSSGIAQGDTAWHTVVVEVVMNSIVGGVTQLDGVARMWLDGKLLWNRTDLEMRTATRAALKLNQFVFAPFIGDNSPITQTMYIGDLEVRTGAGAATNIAVSQQPQGAVDNVAFVTQPTVQLRDASNRPVSQAGVTVTAALLSGSGSLAGTTSVVTNSGGEAAFTNLSINASSPPSNFTLRFTSGSMTADSSSFSVAAAGGGGPTWPNEFVGGTLVSDYGLDAAVPNEGQNGGIQFIEPWAAGWNMVDRRGGGGWLSRVSDATAPVSPGFCIQANYPVGFTGGNEPGVVWRSVSGTRIYIAGKVRVSPGWQGHPSSSVNKLGFTWWGSPNAIYFAFRNSGHLFATTEMSTEGPNNTETTQNDISILDNQWHTIEFEVNKNTTSLRFWVDGLLQGIRTNVPFGGLTLSGVEFLSTWGGAGGSKSQNDWIRWDHVRVRTS